MQYRSFEEAIEFYNDTLQFLSRNEAENSLILGLLAEITRSHSRYEIYSLGCVEDDAGEIVAIAFRTPPHNLLISHIIAENSLDILELIAENMLIEFGTLPGVLGSLPFAEDFAKVWQTKTLQTYTIHMAQGIYQLSEVLSVKSVAGQMRLANEGDTQTLTEWFGAFMEDALGETPPLEESRQQAVRRLANNALLGLVVWEVDAQIVSMAGYAGSTPNGIRVNAVYTPPEHRRHGYATACVADLSQYLLDNGRKFCFLYTDLSNPTSNSIYQKMGYQFVCNSAHIVFNED